jgi:hypothetical protein
VRKSEGTSSLGRQKRRWENGIKMDLREISWVVWSGFSWLKAGSCEHDDEPPRSGTLELASNMIMIN